jgi:hypothetical protein
VHYEGKNLIKECGVSNRKMGTRPNTIFVTIACYRDHVIQSTIDDLLSKADDPYKITVGVFLQQKADENLIPNTYGDRVRVDVQEPGHIFSVCACRNRAMCLIDEEEYVLQIDSHTRFQKGWDTQLINLHKSLDNEKALLSVYLPEWFYGEGGKEFFIERPNTFANFTFNTGESEASFYKYNELVPMPSQFDNPEGKDAVLGWYLCGHFIFGKREFFTSIIQPEWVGFWGEEVINSVRAYTAGWDVYNPANPPLYHLNESRCVDFHRPKLWTDYPQRHSDNRAPTTSRVIETIKNNTVGEWDLFEVRPLKDLYDIIGYDLGELFYRWYKN